MSQEKDGLQIRPIKRKLQGSKGDGRGGIIQSLSLITVLPGNKFSETDICLGDGYMHHTKSVIR